MIRLALRRPMLSWLVAVMVVWLGVRSLPALVVNAVKLNIAHRTIGLRPQSWMGNGIVYYVLSSEERDLLNVALAFQPQNPNVLAIQLGHYLAFQDYVPAAQIARQIVARASNTSPHLAVMVIQASAAALDKETTEHVYQSIERHFAKTPAQASADDAVALLHLLVAQQALENGLFVQGQTELRQSLQYRPSDLYALTWLAYLDERVAADSVTEMLDRISHFDLEAILPSHPALQAFSVQGLRRAWERGQLSSDVLERVASLMLWKRIGFPGGCTAVHELLSVLPEHSISQNLEWDTICEVHGTARTVPMTRLAETDDELRSNQVVDAGFEVFNTGPTGDWWWAPFVGGVWNRALFVGGVDKENPHGGAAALRLDGIWVETDPGKEPARAGYWAWDGSSQNIRRLRVSPHSDFCFSVWYRTQGMPENRQANVYLGEADGFVGVEPGGEFYLPGTQGEWKEFQLKGHNPNARTVNLRLLLRNFGVGSVWFDNVWFGACDA